LVSGLVLLGPFLTRAEAARCCGLGQADLRSRPDLLRLGGIWLEEVYFAFQFDHGGVRRGLGDVVLSLRGRLDDAVIADWLIRPNAILGADTPLRWQDRHGDAAALRAAAEQAVADRRGEAG
jgi:hypothetical protein